MRGPSKRMYPDFLGQNIQFVNRLGRKAIFLGLYALKLVMQLHTCISEIGERRTRTITTILFGNEPLMPLIIVVICRN